MQLGRELKPYATNKRYRWGIIILLVIAPFAKHFYLLFSRDGLGEYIVNNEIFQFPNLSISPPLYPLPQEPTPDLIRREGK